MYQWTDGYAIPVSYPLFLILAMSRERLRPNTNDDISPSNLV